MVVGVGSDLLLGVRVDDNDGEPMTAAPAVSRSEEHSSVRVEAMDGRLDAADEEKDRLVRGARLVWRGC